MPRLLCLAATAFHRTVCVAAHVAVFGAVVAMLVGCASQATSDITGAKADVSDRTVSVSAPSRRRMRVTITAPVAYEVVDPNTGEDK